MMRTYRGFSVGELIRLTQGRLASGQETLVTGVAIDSRQVEPGDLFVCIRGERSDGHDFVDAAAASGAAAVFSARDITADPAVIVVEDPVLALGKLSAQIRTECDPLVIGITGSVGKTTTKDMTAGVVSTKYNTYRTAGNLNTQIGVPFSLAGLHPRHEVAVVEMGMRGPGEIAYLAELARPVIGVVTNVGASHIELTGSIQATAQCKCELLAALGTDGTAVINADDPWCEWMSDRIRARVLRYSLKSAADVTAQTVSVGREGMTFDLTVGEAARTVQMAAWGRHMVSNALAAACIGHAVGIDIDQIAAGLGRFSPGAMRSRLITGQFDIIDDTYNSSPDSAAAAIELLCDIARGRKIAVLGAMLELGAESDTAHREVGRLAAACADILVTVGDPGRLIADGAASAGMDASAILHASANAGAIATLQALLQPGDAVLIKGSRGVAMDEITAAVAKGDQS